MSKLEANMHGATCLWNRGGTYYFRIRVPDDIKHHYGNKPEVRFSLKTKEKQIAVMRATAERLRLLKEFSDKRKSLKTMAESGFERKLQPVTTITPEFIEHVCAMRLRSCLENDDEFRPLLGPDWRYIVRSAEKDREVFPHIKRALANGDIDWIRPLLDAHLNLMGLRLECPENEYRTLAYRFLQTVVKEYQYLFSRDEGNVIETDAVAPGTALTTSAVSLDDLVDSWAGATERPLKTVEAFRRSAKRFSEFLKHKTPEQVTRKDVITYRNHLLAGSTERPKLTVKATRTQIDFLKAIFRRAVANEQISNNPFHDIPFDKVGVEAKRRIPFEPEDLQKIFTTRIFTHHEYENKASGGAASYWLPLLALYTGARLEELGQLRTMDVKEFPQLGWYLDITPEAGSLKTQTSDRHVPLHLKLIELGFVRYVQGLKESGEKRVFPLLKPDRYGRLTSHWSKWFGRYLDEVSVKDPRKVFHSFRHGFKDAARAVGIAEDIQDAITGHANNSVGRRYGNGRYPIQPLFKAIEMIHFPLPNFLCTSQYQGNENNCIDYA